jgi:cytochrome b6-f complex iron-sulfur subunit
MNNTPVSRRDFLKLAQAALLTASGLLGLGGLYRFLSFRSEPPAQVEFDLGDASGYPAGSRTLLPAVPAILLHTDQGFIALSLVCPHLGCTVESKTDGFACPCHGSRFDAHGSLIHGPASKPLVVLKVESGTDGHLHLFTKNGLP